MKAPIFVNDIPQSIFQGLQHQMASDADVTEADVQTRQYYRGEDAELLWVSYQGLRDGAYSLLTWLHKVGEQGMTERSFCVDAIERDMERMRNLDFDNHDNAIGRVAARLEYNLTKACLRYCYGQRYGYMNPYRVFNTAGKTRSDSATSHVRYQGPFDVDIELPKEDYAQCIISKIRHDSIATYLTEIQPQGRYYEQLKAMLPKATGEEMRQAIIINMERARWRRVQPVEEQAKRIVVNIPAYHLWAFDQDSVLDMRVVCGKSDTRTPQLSSNITYLEVNPKWSIPMSIIKNEVSAHAGDSSYFARHRYDIVDNTTGETVSARSVSRAMLDSGRYRIAQKGGAGNSLGRIVFRFKNNFSVYLHDTSSPGAFQREARGLSHGCVRVAKPFDLAHYMLGDSDEWLLDRIRIGMGQGPKTDRGLRYVREHEDVEERNKIIGYVPVKPHVPVFIIYYTLWPTPDGVMQKYPDVYGYDEAIWQRLQPYLKK